jgi:hypothetical protein
MPVKARAAKERRPTFSREVLQLFLELERVPTRRRDRREWWDGSKRLAGLLGLSSEWWAMENVHDRSARPCHPPGYFAHDAWFRCRAMRQALLEAVQAIKDEPDGGKEAAAGL